ncbi:MAG TPA: hypothetical protein VFM31_02450 [Nitrososphaeraceae archaeon]|nr:hypothetical protein [Nitrososphaeraceae archaeon]
MSNLSSIFWVFSKSGCRFSAPCYFNNAFNSFTTCSDWINHLLPPLLSPLPLVVVVVAAAASTIIELFFYIYHSYYYYNYYFYLSPLLVNHRSLMIYFYEY